MIGLEQNPLQTIGWLLNIATSIAFLIPGYIVVKTLQATRESRPTDHFELTLQSLIFSLAISLGWLYITPSGCTFRTLTISEGSSIWQKAGRSIISGEHLASAFFWYLIVTVFVALIAAYVQKQGFFWALLKRLGFDRLNRSLTPWEDFVDLSRQKWVSVETQSGATYVGLVLSASHYPFEKSLILTGDKGEPIKIIKAKDQDIRKENCSASHIWLSADEIKSIGVFANE